jgi:hypothetical protein
MDSAEAKFNYRFNHNEEDMGASTSLSVDSQAERNPIS